MSELTLQQNSENLWELVGWRVFVSKLLKFIVKGNSSGRWTRGDSRRKEGRDLWMFELVMVRYYIKEYLSPELQPTSRADFILSNKILATNLNLERNWLEAFKEKIEIESATKRKNHKQWRGRGSQKDKRTTWESKNQKYIETRMKWETCNLDQNNSKGHHAGRCRS